MEVRLGTTPVVSRWRIHALRFVYLLIAVGLSSFVWQQLIFESSDWSLMRGIAKCMFGALALLAAIGIRYPLQMLPIMLFEMLWKAIWIVAIALPAGLNGRWIIVESTFYECVGIALIFVIMPWRYVWTQYFRESKEAAQ